MVKKKKEATVLASGDDDVVDETILPWGRIVAFLPLKDMLRCRLVSSEIAARIHEGILPKDCARWFAKALRRWNLFLIPGNVDQLWKDATNNDFEQLLLMFSESRSTQQQEKKEGQTPLDGLLRTLRVCQCIPYEAAVTFSGKYGRHIVAIDSQAPRNVTLYEVCRRGRKQCPSCRFKIPRIPRHRMVDDGANDEGNVNPDGDEDDEPVTCLDDVLQIAVNAREKVDLDRYYVTCVPNLPADLVCPKCRVSDQRTLILTEMTYVTPEETAPGALQNKLTFTPCHAPRRKRPRLAQQMSADTTFPPIHPAFFIPGGPTHDDGEEEDDEEEGESTSGLPYGDYKHAIAIHCTACREFGIVGPAGLCVGNYNDSNHGTSTRGCRGKFKVGDKYGNSVGGILCRIPCGLRRSCFNAIGCETCRRESEYCPTCYNHNEALQWHA